MAHGRRSGRPGGAPASADKPGLEALADLRLQLAQRQRREPPSRPARAPAVKPERPGEHDDEALFRQAVGDVAPLRAGQRVELDKPKPAPLPRHPTPDEAEPATAAAPAQKPLGDAALLRAAFLDVTPLRGAGRIEIERVRPAAHARSAADQPDHLKNKLAGLPALPAETAALDAESLFQLATLGAQPLPDNNRIEPNATPPLPEPLQRGEDDRAALRETMEAPISFEDRLDMGDEAAFLRPGLPRRVVVDLRRGRWVLQGELDLHGLTREQAREALGHFLADSLTKGRRCVRIIHGKGLGSPGRESILKQLSRGWLAQREEILAFCQAGPHQGGGGALMVLLRAPSAGSA